MAPQSSDHGFAEALYLASTARHVEVFTGAGMSAESGIVTYRDADTGLWENVDPMAMASIDAWRRDPEPMWAWYLWRAQLASQAEPNAGHRAIARWAELDGVDAVTVTTQNIDNLHERAGSENVVHLHGSLFIFCCSNCRRPYDDVDFPTEAVPRLTPPPCPACGSLIRPDIVWFGEGLPSDAWGEAERRMETADLIVIVGTSGVVYPAAQLPFLAYRQGTPILEISPQETELTRLAAQSWRTTAAVGLPLLVDALADRS